MESLIEKTAAGYVQKFRSFNLLKQHKLFFFNLPAPVYHENLTRNANYDRANVISKFNQILEKNVYEHGYDLIDVYRHTCSEEGLSNMRYHVDKTHLGSSILSLLEANIPCNF